MKKFLKSYVDPKYSFDTITIIGIICLIVVIAGVFGFLYELISTIKDNL